MKEQIHEHKKRSENPNFDTDIENLVLLNFEPVSEESTYSVEGCDSFPNEGAENAITSEMKKFCTGEQLVVTYKFKKPIFMKGYTVMTANDFPVRDPKGWEVIASDVNIHTGESKGEVTVSCVQDKEPINMRWYEERFALEQPLWTDQVTFKVTETYVEEDDEQTTQIGQFGILI